MHFSNLFFVLALMIPALHATDCRLAKNMPSSIKIGQIFPINDMDFYQDKEPHLETKMSGSIIVLSSCSFQLIDFSLSNALYSHNIKIYGFGGRTSFPVNNQVLYGDYESEDGPIFTFSNEANIVERTLGVSWQDFSSLRIYAVDNQWVISDVKLGSSVETSEDTSEDTSEVTSENHERKMNAILIPDVEHELLAIDTTTSTEQDSTSEPIPTSKSSRLFVFKCTSLVLFAFMLV